MTDLWDKVTDNPYEEIGGRNGGSANGTATGQGLLSCLTSFQKCFNHVHVQKRGFTKFSVFLERVSLLNRGFIRILWLFLWKEPGKSLEVRFDFGPRPGFSKQLFGSSREGTELDRTYFKQFLSLRIFGPPGPINFAVLCST